MPEPSDPKPVPIPSDDAELLAQCRVDVFRSGGPGGQHQNTTESGVRLTHGPTGIVVSSRSHRSQARNKSEAVARLRARLEEMNRPTKRRVPTKPTRGAVRKRVEQKKKRSETKRLRRPPKRED